MHDVLCIFYSRTGKTREAMEEIAAALDAEVVELTDGVDRKGFRGWLRSGMDAVKRDCPAVRPFDTERKLENYRLVVIGTPVWAGRCCSIVRSFLKENGRALRRTAFVITRGSEHRSEEIYEQMDSFLPIPHRAAVSLRVGSVGHTFWQEEFLRQAQDILGEKE
ncbi:MAG: hypothetical protein IKN53_07070 [Oscillibacter sp.]|nr:hypothetical protein [Oscillibacter sp.]